MDFDQLTRGFCLEQDSKWQHEFTTCCECDENAALPVACDEIRAKPADELIQVDFYVEMLLWLNSLNLDVPTDLRQEKKPFSLPLLRWMLAYALYGGLEKGIVYTWPCGRPLDIKPETIDEVFDGKATEHLPVTDDWSEEVELGYDRGIRFAVERAVAGEITQKPSKKRWLSKLILLDLARRTLDHDLYKDT